MPHNELALVSGSRNSDHKGTAVFGSFGGTCEGLRRKTRQQEELINHVDTQNCEVGNDLDIRQYLKYFGGRNIHYPRYTVALSVLGRQEDFWAIVEAGFRGVQSCSAHAPQHSNPGLPTFTPRAWVVGNHTSP